MLPSEIDDIRVLASCVFPPSRVMGSPGFIFQAPEEVLLKPGYPLVEGLTGDAEVTGSQGYILAVFLPEDDPF